MVASALYGAELANQVTHSWTTPNRLKQHAYATLRDRSKTHCPPVRAAASHARPPAPPLAAAGRACRAPAWAPGIRAGRGGACVASPGHRLQNYAECRTRQLTPTRLTHADCLTTQRADCPPTHLPGAHATHLCNERLHLCGDHLALEGRTDTRHVGSCHLDAPRQLSNLLWRICTHRGSARQHRCKTQVCMWEVQVSGWRWGRPAPPQPPPRTTPRRPYLPTGTAQPPQPAPPVAQPWGHPAWEAGRGSSVQEGQYRGAGVV